MTSGIKFTDDYLIKKLKEAFVILGYSPSRRILATMENFPKRTAYVNHFGSLENAKKIAGIPPSPKGMDHPNLRKAIHDRWKKFGYKKHARPSLSLRFKILKRDNFTCQYCGNGVKDGFKLEVDHIIPISKGGKTSEGNLITSCFFCNHGKRTNILDNL